MKLVLAGTEYSVNDALQKATLSDLLQLKVKTGIGMKTLKKSLDSMSKLADPEDFLDDEPILLALNALVWLCRRHAGEKLSLDDANAVPLDEISFNTDDEPAAVETDPTPAPTDSGAVDASVA